MPDFIKIPVHIFVLFLPVALIGNIGLAAFLLNLSAQFVRVIAFVCDNSLGFRQIYGCYQFRRDTDVIDIACRNNDLQRITAGINHQVNLTGHAAPTHTNSMLIFTTVCGSSCRMLVYPDVTAIHHQPFFISIG